MQLTREGNESKIVSHVRKVNGRGPFVDDIQQAILSIEIWKQAFKDASERLCPLRAGGHECGCLPMLCRLVSTDILLLQLFGGIFFVLISELSLIEQMDTCFPIDSLPKKLSSMALTKEYVGNYFHHMDATTMKFE